MGKELREAHWLSLGLEPGKLIRVELLLVLLVILILVLLFVIVSSLRLWRWGVRGLFRDQFLLNLYYLLVGYKVENGSDIPNFVFNKEDLVLGVRIEVFRDSLLAISLQVVVKKHISKGLIFLDFLPAESLVAIGDSLESINHCMGVGGPIWVRLLHSLKGILNSNELVPISCTEEANSVS